MDKKNDQSAGENQKSSAPAQGDKEGTTPSKKFASVARNLALARNGDQQAITEIAKAAVGAVRFAADKINEWNVKGPLLGGLHGLLVFADDGDLDILVDYITDNGAGRISLSDDACLTLLSAKNKGAYSEAERNLISDEIRRYGGNTLVNLFRRDGVNYSEVVRDVATRLKVPFEKDENDVVVEEATIRHLFAYSLEKMTPEDRNKLLDELNVTDVKVGGSVSALTIALGKAGGFTTYKIAVIVANAAAKAILGHGLSVAGNVVLTRTLSVMLGPVGWIISALWTAFDLGSPAYRVTVPCVIQIAYIRQKYIARYSARENSASEL